LQPRRIAIIIVASGGLGFGCLSLLGGCGDDSRTTGTQVQLTPEDKDLLKDMRGVMKDQRAAQKAERKKRPRAGG